MFESAFSYNITRPYPFRWFTPVVIVGGIVVTVLVSLISVATSGYELVTVSVPDPNVTAASHSWLNNWPSFLVGNLLPTCDSSTIALNTELFTNNSALPYSLTGVWQNTDEKQISSGSLAYHNNRLEGCQVTKIDIEFESMQRPARVIAIQQQGATLSAYVTCNIDTAEGQVWMSLTANYDYVLDALNMEASTLSFAGRNATTQPSLFWGESMLAAYWIQLTNALFVENQKEEFQYYKGTVNFRRYLDPPTTEDGVKSLGDFFQANSFFLPFSGSGEQSIVAFSGNTSNSTAALASTPGGRDNPVPSIWIPADTLSKTLYYTILTDLGQVNDTFPNLLASPDLLQYFTSNFTDIYAGNDIDFEHAAAGKGMATQPFDPQDTSEQKPMVNPSVLNTNYLCQVPRRKAGASLVFSVLLADLVLLQTIWQVYKLIVGWLLDRWHPEMNKCEGRAERTTNGERDGLALEQLSRKPTAKAGRGAYVELRDRDHELEGA